MMQNGLREDQVVEVRGLAAQHLRNPQNPNDASNRRISMLVKYQEQDKVPDPAPATEKTAKQP